jgi:repressor of nif and glnA expression
MDKQKIKSTYQRLAVQDKHRRMNNLSNLQLYVLNDLVLQEMGKQLNKQPIPPLTDEMSVRSLNYHFRNLVKMGFLKKEGNEHTVTDKAYKMFEGMYNDPGIEFLH